MTSLMRKAVKMLKRFIDAVEILVRIRQSTAVLHSKSLRFAVLISCLWVSVTLLLLHLSHALLLRFGVGKIALVDQLLRVFPNIYLGLYRITRGQASSAG